MREIRPDLSINLSKFSYGVSGGVPLENHIDQIFKSVKYVYSDYTVFVSLHTGVYEYAHPNLLDPMVGKIISSFIPIFSDMSEIPHGAPKHAYQNERFLVRYGFLVSKRRDNADPRRKDVFFVVKQRIERRWREFPFALPKRSYRVHGFSRFYEKIADSLVLPCVSYLVEDRPEP